MEKSICKHCGCEIVKVCNGESEWWGHADRKSGAGLPATDCGLHSPDAEPIDDWLLDNITKSHKKQNQNVKSS